MARLSRFPHAGTRRLRAAFVVVGAYVGIIPVVIPLVFGSRLNTTDWLALWGLCAILGGYLIVFGLTLKSSSASGRLVG